MQRGEHQSAICPYGYRKSGNGHMEPDPESAVFDTMRAQMEAVASELESDPDTVSALTSQRDSCAAQADALMDGKRELYERLMLGEIGQDAYKQEKAELDARLTQLENSLALMKAQLKREQEQLS